MTKKYLIIALGLSLIFTSCGKKEKENEVKTGESTQFTETSKTRAEEEKKLDEQIKEDADKSASSLKISSKEINEKASSFLDTLKEQIPDKTLYEKIRKNILKTFDPKSTKEYTEPEFKIAFFTSIKNAFVEARQEGLKSVSEDDVNQLEKYINAEILFTDYAQNGEGKVLKIKTVNKGISELPEYNKVKELIDEYAETRPYLALYGITKLRDVTNADFVEIAKKYIKFSKNIEGAVANGELKYDKEKDEYVQPMKDSKGETFNVSYDKYGFTNNVQTK